MAMKVAQIIKTAQNENDIINFIADDVNKNLVYVHDYNFDDSDYSFYNSCIEGPFRPEESYYIKAQILKKDTAQEIMIEFYDGVENTQRIKRISIPAADKYSTTYEVEMVASPSVAYDFISFRLSRTANDYTFNEINDDMLRAGQVIGMSILENYTIPGRIVKFSNPNREGLDNIENSVKIVRLKNVFESLKDKTIKKIGIQGLPGTIMSINGEEIRIGYRGVYELLNDVIITSLGIYPSDLNYPIIIDYQYEDRQGGN